MISRIRSVGVSASNKGISVKVPIRKISDYIRRWINYSALSQCYRPIPKLDKWIRCRLRM
ncbi:MAG: group II intron maturase-specific domain-containing protein [bacterium]